MPEKGNSHWKPGGGGKGVNPDLPPKLSQQFLGLESLWSAARFHITVLLFRLHENDTISLPVVYSLLRPRTLPRCVCGKFLVHKNRITVRTSIQDHFFRHVAITVVLTDLSTNTICSYNRCKTISAICSTLSNNIPIHNCYFSNIVACELWFGSPLVYI
ncbi:hypothetical protein TNCV_2171591 [Trichonephila clavipes]|nr:hypothetical protein TNCV_2171591 [Trichonephila clavipes]